MLRDGKGEFPQGHRLEDLWRKCRPLIEEACSDGEKADTDSVEKCLQEFHKLDPRGISLRYGEDRNGSPTLPTGTQLNLANLRDVMNRIAAFLDGSYDWMYELLRYQADIDGDSF